MMFKYYFSKFLVLCSFILFLVLFSAAPYSGWSACETLQNPECLSDQELYHAIIPRNFQVAGCTSMPLCREKVNSQANTSSQTCGPFQIYNKQSMRCENKNSACPPFLRFCMWGERANNLCSCSPTVESLNASPQCVAALKCPDSRILNCRATRQIGVRNCNLLTVPLSPTVTTINTSRSLPRVFIYPTTNNDPQVFGFKNGLQLALYPHSFDDRVNGGPRGLIRVGFADGGYNYLINYIAVEPLVNNSLGLSELEYDTDGKQGKNFQLISTSILPIGGTINSAESISFSFTMNRFINGAKPTIKATFYRNQPDRVEFTIYSEITNNKIQRITLSSTMGNQTRARHLWLKDRVISSLDLYKNYYGDGFIEDREYKLDELLQLLNGDVIVALTSDELKPNNIKPFGNNIWYYPGPWLTQYWLKEKNELEPTIKTRVNGRYTYWLTRVPIPGGTAFENFEIREPFRNGQKVWFGITQKTPQEAFGFNPVSPPKMVTN